MLTMNLQFFAHKKGVGSTKNVRDSESKIRSEESRPDSCKLISFTDSVVLDSPRCECW